ncbi:MAG: thioredoxin TrxC [Oceanospirillaceae bacterium]|jgi:thioredoxin 2|uniref:thioredoxin TrxC n=1 Tax=Marinobacterium litorale TaxID=404770 RepID=UPI000485C5E6|nr:thioredoxin TrxC [Marinobacterium litorale]MBS98593.1 thioredoxin TrxC [Oceanospirillaceae bacterium]
MSNALTLSCPSCFVTNRVPVDRLAQAPVCGRCGAPLFQGRPVATNEAQFEKLIANTELPVVVDFWADWCGPCKMMAPIFEQAARSFEPRCRFVKVDTEQAPGLSARYGIRSIPTLIVFRDGREVGRQAGALDRSALERWVGEFL